MSRLTATVATLPAWRERARAVIRLAAILVALLPLVGCSDSDPPVLPAPTATAIPTPTATPQPFCRLPGSVRFHESSREIVAGGSTDPHSLDFLQLPPGFCAHVFASVGNPRQLRFAPGGELFVSSPSRITASNGPNGRAAILVLPDDDGDGVADSALPFLDLPTQTHGILFGGGSFFFQDGTRILRLPYMDHRRQAFLAEASEFANIDIYESDLHWPKPLDMADDGTIYVGNGGDQGELCDPAKPFRGGVLKLDGSNAPTPVVRGLRNPISIRCLRRHNRCFAIELGRDLSQRVGGREKLDEIHEGEDWGFPCCITQNKPYPEFQQGTDCSDVKAESGTFLIGNTPFDVDFETGLWPAPWTHRAFVPLHGAYATWGGADLVALEMDPISGELVPGSTLPEQAPGSLLLFASGWDDHTLKHGRPTSVAFASDGRLFLSDDTNGLIFWVAPVDLPSS